MKHLPLRWEEKEILITVKAYPNPSKKYLETVCIAGVSQGQWIRLYPLRFRHLPYKRMFKKYDIIKVMVTKHTSDPRPESYRPNPETISCGIHLDTKDKWKKRKDYLLPTANESMCEILELQKETGKSLGMFKPREVLDLKMKQERDEWTNAEMIQLSLFEPNIKPVEQIPYSFKYSYLCSDPRCKGHNMKIIDWEIAQLYRNLKKQHGDNIHTIEKKIRDKYLHQMFGKERDSYFFVGNTRAYPQSFVILGIFWPPIS